MVAIELRTKRLLLRRFLQCDVEDSLGYRNDRELAKFLPHIPQPFTRQHAEEFVARNMTEPWETLPTFAVVFEHHVIGTVSFEIEPHARTAMLGYAIARAHWGRGLATEAAAAALGWLFEAHDLVEVWASVDPANVASRRLLEKLGMTEDPQNSTDQAIRYRRSPGR